MSPKRKLKASDERRRQILDAALELFLEVGVGDCRVDDLLARADVSVGSLYHHFGSKPGVGAALQLEILERYQADFLSELQAHRSARAGVRAIVGHHLAWVANDPQRAAFLFQCLEPEVLTVCSEEENRMTTAFFSTCAAWVEELDANGYFAIHALPGPQDEEFYVGGRATRVTDLNAREQVLGAMPYEDADDDHLLYVFSLERALWTRWANFQKPGMRPIHRVWKPLHSRT